MHLTADDCRLVMLLIETSQLDEDKEAAWELHDRIQRSRGMSMVTHDEALSASMMHDDLTMNRYITQQRTREAEQQAEIERLREALTWVPMSSAKRPHQGQRVIVLTTDADDDPHQVFANWNGEKIGFLGIGGHRVKPVTHWIAPTPLVAALNTEGAN